MNIHIFKDSKKEFRWNLIARNGRKVACSGEGYKTKASLLKILSKIHSSNIIDDTL